MADFALDFGTTGNVNGGSSADIDNLASLTILGLYRGDALFNTFASFTSKRNEPAGTSGWMLALNGARRWVFQDDRATTDVSVDTQTATAGTDPAKWYWIAATYDSALGTNSVELMASEFGSPLTSLTLGTTNWGSGARVSDAAQDLRIGFAGDVRWNDAIAFVGLWSGKQSLSTVQGYIDNLSGAAASALRAYRLGNGGSATAAIDFSPAAQNGTATNSTLVTDAPDYWTAAGPAPYTGTLDGRAGGAAAAATGAFVTGGTYTPVLPSAPALGASALTPTLVLVTWTAPPEGVTSYRLQRRTPAGTGVWADRATGLTGTSFGDNTVLAATSYGYRLAAANAVGEGPFSDEAAVTTPSGAASSTDTRTSVAQATGVTSIT